MNTPADESFDSDEEDAYDAHGNYSPGGLFDAGGHPIPERWAGYADWVLDSMKDRAI